MKAFVLQWIKDHETSKSIDHHTFSVIMEMVEDLEEMMWTTTSVEYPDDISGITEDQSDERKR